jgi:hypothetical protein
MTDKTLGELESIAEFAYMQILKIKEDMERNKIYFDMPKFIEVDELFFHFEKDKLIAIRPKYYPGSIAIDATVRNDQ